MWTNRVFEQMDRLFGPIGFSTPFPTSAAPPYPALNVWEDEDNYYVGRIP